MARSVVRATSSCHEHAAQARLLSQPQPQLSRRAPQAQPSNHARHLVTLLVGLGIVVIVRLPGQALVWSSSSTDKVDAHSGLPDSDPQDVTLEAERTLKVDYVLDEAWVVAYSPRVMILEMPEHSDEAESLQGQRLGGVRRYILPRRPQDLGFLSTVSSERLRVDLLPHYRAADPHLHVRVLTDAVQPFSAPTPTQRSFFRRWFSKRQYVQRLSLDRWLLLFETVLRLPDTVSMTGCIADWSWGSMNNPSAKESGFDGPFRMLQVTCPFRSRTFLGRIGKKAQASSLQRLLLTALFVVCFAQLVLMAAVAVAVVLQVTRAVFIVAMQARGRGAPIRRIPLRT